MVKEKLTFTLRNMEEAAPRECESSATRTQSRLHKVKISVDIKQSKKSIGYPALFQCFVDFCFSPFLLQNIFKLLNRW